MQPVENARVIESAADGICVVLDGVEMYLGKRGYMKRCRFARRATSVTTNMKIRWAA